MEFLRDVRICASVEAASLDALEQADIAEHPFMRYLSTFLLAVGAVLTLACARPAPRVHHPESDVAYIQANGMRFAYYAAGDPNDPLVLLLHGFPDTAHAWDELRPRIAAEGYYVVSPFTRGYAPSDAGAAAKYDVETLGRDTLALITALGAEQAVVVGHDWGAMAAYSAVALDPSKVRKLVTLTIPHPAGLKLRVRDLYRARHFIALRKRRAAKKVRRNDYAYVDKIYKRWSPQWAFTAQDLDAVKNSFAAPGAPEGALGYYRDLSFKVPEFLKAKTPVPALVVAGVQDGTTPLDAFDNDAGFAGGVQLEKLEAGHFPHREQPEAFLALLLEFLKR